ncbi:MAG: protein-methionine-sulfoxide reductase catalytic subunit MsrP [Pigmentiphaga sp.]|nr:protein-methionine-sulfoxide reductase catalytic subunit MsrP [Pigmentiphaga sp.]
MRFRVRPRHDPLPSEITPLAVYQQRRQLLQAALAGAALGAAGLAPAARAQPVPPVGQALPGKPNPAFSVLDRPTSRRDITTYNNFYEFGTDKGDPARHAGRMEIRPWTVRIEGEVLKPRDFDLDDLLRLAPLEERVYRLRCVEAWSMVIPWIGYPLNHLLRAVQPTGNAKYVTFETAMQPETMPGLRSRIIAWPYLEALRLDEAQHPLTLLAFGLYGEVLPNQNGAPLRLVVPWKYGFKSGKSLVRIRLTEQQPVTSWMRAASNEYGFYANVNPDVDHPRWSQATERRIGEDGFFRPPRRTLMFNGYADQVASLYQGMDLRANY